MRAVQIPTVRPATNLAAWARIVEWLPALAAGIYLALVGSLSLTLASLVLMVRRRTAEPDGDRGGNLTGGEQRRNELPGAGFLDAPAPGANKGATQVADADGFS